jgi:hypothetical protein
LEVPRPFKAEDWVGLEEGLDRGPRRFQRLTVELEAHRHRGYDLFGSLAVEGVIPAVEPGRARSAQARMPTVSSHPQKIIQSVSSSRWTPSSASGGDPAHSATSTTPLGELAGKVEAGPDFDLSEAMGGRVDLAAQQIDVGGVPE